MSPLLLFHAYFAHNRPNSLLCANIFFLYENGNKCGTFLKCGKRVLIPSCCTVGIYMNETSVSGRRAVMLSTGLMEILTAWSHDSFCFNFCIHTLIWAFRSLSSVASSSMQAMMTIFFRSSTNNWLTWVKNASSFVENGQNRLLWQSCPLL